jgi:hypothetical protein
MHMGLFAAADSHMLSGRRSLVLIDGNGIILMQVWLALFGPPVG